MSTSVTAIGNLTRNPQLSRTGDGTPVVNPSLADTLAAWWTASGWTPPTGRCAVSVRRPSTSRRATPRRPRDRGRRRPHPHLEQRRREDQSALEIVADEIGPSLRWTTTERARTPG